MSYTENFYINAKDLLPVEELPRPKFKYPLILLNSGEDPKGDING